MRRYLRMLKVLWQLRRTHRDWWKPSDRSHAEPDGWPTGFGPTENPVYARNMIKIGRPPDEVFEKLMLAELWPQWYDNSVDVDIHARSTPGERFVPGGVRERAIGVGGRGEAPPAEADNVRHPTATAIPGEGPPATLEEGVEFSWTTFGIRVRSEVKKFKPGERIDWTAQSLGVQVYHRWYFRPDRDGTFVVTEECEKGPLPRLTQRLMNKGLHAGHQLWLESLREPGP